MNFLKNVFFGYILILGLFRLHEVLWDEPNAISYFPFNLIALLIKWLIFLRRNNVNLMQDIYEWFVAFCYRGIVHALLLI